MSITKIPPAGLEDVGVTPGTKGSSTEIPVVTVNSKGQVTQLGGAALDLSSKANTSGNNATGTWPINISGNANTASSASSVAWGNVTGRPTDLGAFSNGPNYMNAATGSGSGFNCNAGPTTGSVTSVSLSRSGTTAVLSVGTACACCY